MFPVQDLNSLIEKEVFFDYSQSSGPGGQNVNKVSTAVQLRFDILHSAVLSEQVKHHLIRIAGKRVTAEGILVINARRFRAQEQNRKDALQRLGSWIEKARCTPPKRRPTRPTRAAQARRLQSKKLHAIKKGYRRKPGIEG